jgi:xanthine/uracil/vitamin C permease (AzgA family)
MYVYLELMVRMYTNSLQPKERKDSRFSTEFRAGLATFFAMAYIISVNCTAY